MFYHAKFAVFWGILALTLLPNWSGTRVASAQQMTASHANVHRLSIISSRRSVAPVPPSTVGARLTATPSLTDVGDQVTLTLTATHFTPHSSVIVRFLSPHHGFSGSMPWDPRCNCFRLAIFLAKRVHPLELSRASAVITAGKASTTAYTTFQIRGLTPSGQAYVPGGAATFSVWVGDPAPVATEFQHYCVWARTADALGISGLTVKFTVRFQQHTETWRAGVTGASGVLCARRSIGHPLPGFNVYVDAYAGNLHAQTNFTPRA